jgi:hypothetical protein
MKGSRRLNGMLAHRRGRLDLGEEATLDREGHVAAFARADEGAGEMGVPDPALGAGPAGPGTGIVGNAHVVDRVGPIHRTGVRVELAVGRQGDAFDDFMVHRDRPGRSGPGGGAGEREGSASNLRPHAM